MKTYNIIGGVNGVGKTSFTGARKQDIPDIGIIVNVDQITAQLGGDLLKGGKEALRQINSYLDRGISFTQETTLSGVRTEKTARAAKELGYTVRLYYIALDSIDESLDRIQNRVKKGGHNIPIDDVERRFENRWESVRKVLPYCDTADFYDNNNGFDMVAQYRNGEFRTVAETKPLWLVELIDYLSNNPL